ARRHDAIGAEQVEHVIAIAPYLVGRPAPAHDDIEADRELHRDVAVLGGAGNLRRPRLPAPLRERRPAEMIDHDLELWQATRDVEQGFELRGVPRDRVEGEPRRSQELERFDHAVLQQPAWIRLVTDEMATAG